MLNNLIIDQFGIFLGKHSERLVVRKGKETLSEHALMNLEQVIIASPGVSLSSDLIKVRRLTQSHATITNRGLLQRELSSLLNLVRSQSLNCFLEQSMKVSGVTLALEEFCSG